MALRDLAGIAPEGAFLKKQHAIRPMRIDPLTLDGQVIGPLAPGLGGAFLERLVDDEQNQLLTG